MADLPSLRRVAQNLLERSQAIQQKADATDAEKEDAKFLFTSSLVIRDAILELNELRSRKGRL